MKISGFSIDTLLEHDKDARILMDMAHGMKEEGNKMFEMREYDRALLTYEKAIKLLPKNQIDVAYLHSNMAACYMHMKPEKYHHAINECNLALEVSPHYSKALLKRAKCFEALNRLDLASKDLDIVLSLEPNNLSALEISTRVKKEIAKRDNRLNCREDSRLPETPIATEKPRKKKNNISEKKLVVAEEKHSEVKEQIFKSMKLVFGEDIRYAQVPTNCTMLRLREIVNNKFPSLKSFLVKYKDKEADLLTIAAPEDLERAEQSAYSQGSVRLYIVEVRPKQDPSFEEAKNEPSWKKFNMKINGISENESIRRDDENISSVYIDDWIVQFGHLFKNQVGYESEAFLNLHELGLKLYSEILEEAVTSEEAFEIFELAEEKFQEMSALALLNWGNVHMSRARKRLLLSENVTKESMLLVQVQASYEWAQAEFVKAGKRYEEALFIKPDLYEGFLALGLQQFERAKLSWCCATRIKEEQNKWPSSEVLGLFNLAEENIVRGLEIWEEMEEQRLNELSISSGKKILSQKMGLEDFFMEFSTHEAAEMSVNMRSQIHILWGTVLYERSIVEFKLGIALWEECLLAAEEKFTLAGASATDIAVIRKSHNANLISQADLSFKIDEIIQEWNEMYDAKKWITGVSSFRLEPLLGRRVPKLHSTVEHL